MINTSHHKDWRIYCKHAERSCKWFLSLYCYGEKSHLQLLHQGPTFMPTLSNIYMVDLSLIVILSYLKKQEPLIWLWLFKLRTRTITFMIKLILPFLQVYPPWYISKNHLAKVLVDCCFIFANITFLNNLPSLGPLIFKNSSEMWLRSMNSAKTFLLSAKRRFRC